MIIVGLTDIHGDLAKIDRLKEVLEAADLILLVGDLTSFGRRPEMEALLGRVLEINQNCLAVPGNCDYPETEKVLNDLSINLNGSHKIIQGIAFIGLGASLPTPANGTPFEVAESYFEQQLTTSLTELNPTAPKILVSHQPPLNTTADAVNPHLHVGSLTVRSFIEKHQPLVCFTGHIHEGQGVDRIGDTLIINPGPVYKGFYAYAEIDTTVKCLEVRKIN